MYHAISITYRIIFKYEMFFNGMKYFIINIIKSFALLFVILIFFSYFFVLSDTDAINRQVLEYTRI